MKLVWRSVRWLALILAGLFLIAQLIRPARTNPVIDQSMTLESQAQLDPKIGAMLQRSCYDCHSNQTRWPWYSNVAPVSWFVIGHVNDGRRELNFSEWGKYDRGRRYKRLDQMCNLARAGAMPLASYTPLHPGSKLTQEDVRILCDWTFSQQH
jgi:heme-binding protein